MGDRTSIEWSDATWNPIRARNIANGKVGWYCVHASDGCRNFYAESLNRLRGTGVDFKAQTRDQVEIFVDPKMLAQPLHWRRPRKIFVCSMTDIAAPFVSDEMLDQVWAAMAVAHWHTFQILTKRPERLRAYINSIPDRLEQMMNVVIDHPIGRRQLWKLVDVAVFAGPLRNVWIGTSAEDQETLEIRAPSLLDTPAAIRFLSLEPLIGPIDIKPRDYPEQCIRCGLGPSAVHDHPDGYRPHGIDMIIVGGESGRGARPMHPDWVRQIRNDCAKAGVPFFFKQWGMFKPSELGAEINLVNVDIDGRWESSVGCYSFRQKLMARVGKKAAGRTLDGVIHDAMPDVAS